MIKFSKDKVLLLHRLIAQETGGTPILWLQRGHFCAVAGLDPNRDPNAETTGEYGVETADVPLRRKYAKGAESAGQQRFSPLIVSSHAGGHWFESSSLHQIPPHLRWDFSFA